MKVRIYVERDDINSGVENKISFQVINNLSQTIR